MHGNSLSKAAAATLVALLLSGCAYSSRLERNIGTGAVTGGVVGAVAGGLIGAAVTEPRRCMIRTGSGRWRRGWCR